MLIATSSEWRLWFGREKPEGVEQTSAQRTQLDGHGAEQNL